MRVWSTKWNTGQIQRAWIQTWATIELLERYFKILEKTNEFDDNTFHLTLFRPTLIKQPNDIPCRGSIGAAKAAGGQTEMVGGHGPFC